MLIQEESQIKSGKLSILSQHRDGQRSQRPLRFVVLGHHDQCHLEQRVTAGLPLRLQLLDHVLESDVLMIKGGEVGLAHPGQQLTKRRIAGDIGAQHDGVDEQTDQVGQCLVITSSDHRPQRNVGPRPEETKGQGHRGLKHHERGDPTLVGQLVDATVQLRINGKRHPGTGGA